MAAEHTQRGVVFVHGLFSSGSTWDQFRNLVAQDAELRPFETLTFSYVSRPAVLNPQRRLPSFDDVADNLRGFLEVDARHFGNVVLVAHSQGGLIVQRYLSRMLHDGRGLELARIRRVVLFACPNLGSELALSLRRAIWRGRHPQEHQLRPITQAVTEAQRTVVTRIDHATAGAADQCPIAITAYAGDTDNIVTSASARSVFRDVGVLPGDHSTIIRPDSSRHRSYTVLKHLLLMDPPTWKRPGGGSDVTETRSGDLTVGPGTQKDDTLSSTIGAPASSSRVVVGSADPQVHAPRRVTEWSARLLGVKPAIEAKGAQGDLPRYVPRDHDRELRLALRETATNGGLVVLEGEPSTGKSRSAYEALTAELPDWRLVRPHTAKDLDELVTSGSSHTVVWLDDLSRFLDAPGGLTAADLLRLIDAYPPIVFVAALWPGSYDDSAERSGAADGSALSEAREILRLAKIVSVAEELTESEWAAARSAAAEDPRIAAALIGADFGLFQTLAGAPVLLRRWRGGDPYGRAVLNASIDALRVGGPEVLTLDYLRAAAPGYLTSSQWARATPNWLDSALAYCAERVDGATAALSPVSGVLAGSTVGYRLADYLLRVGEQHRRFSSVPTEAWRALLRTVVEPQILGRIGWNAEWRLLYELAHDFYTSAGQDGVTRRAALLTHQGLSAQALELLEQDAQKGNAAAVKALVSQKWPTDTGPEDVVARLAPYVSEHPSAAEEVARALDRLGRTEESIHHWVGLAEHNHSRAVKIAVGHLLRLDRRPDALELLRNHAGSDPVGARPLLVRLLLEEKTEAGRTEAESWLRRWLEEGDSLGLLPDLLLDQGRLREVEELADLDLDRARDSLVGYWADRGAADPESARRAVEICRRWAKEKNGEWVLLHLLTRLGRTEEAVEAAVTFEREHGANDDLNAVITSMLVDQGRVEEVRARADSGDSRAQSVVAEQLMASGRIAELGQRAARGELPACQLLSDWLGERGRVAEAVSLWHQWAESSAGGYRYPLFDFLERHGLDDELMQLLEAEREPLGKRNGRRLARLLVKKSRIAELRDRAAGGDPYADAELVSHLMEHGQYEEACQRAVAGSGAATRMLLAEAGSGRELVPGLMRHGLRLDGSVAVPHSASGRKRN
ncbi:alpha/beta hydrolase [Streptomyces sp. SID5910]|uniref:alpha/beta fold hydrolase n=1 Tax=Streptomyces sp. SID5910 TaxID=2690312 RepID=UPI00136B72AA|nr:hypothetical protein [Streptomyces sp. SID5910]